MKLPVISDGKNFSTRKINFGFTPLETGCSATSDYGDDEVKISATNTKFNTTGKLLTGFTLIELLIVIAIFLILAGLSVPLVGRLFTDSQLITNTNQFLFDLRLARDRSIAGLGGEPHGAYFNETIDGLHRYTLYQGVDYASRDNTFDQIVVLPTVLKFEANWLNEEINFSLGTGLARISFLGPETLSGSTTISLIHEVEGESIILVNRYGAIFREN